MVLLFSSSITVPSEVSYAYKTFATGKVFNDPSVDEKPVALTVFPSTNSSTYACLPEHDVSAHVSKPRRHPFCISVAFKVGWRKLSA